MAHYRQQKNILFLTLVSALLGFLLMTAVHTYDRAQQAVAAEQDTDTQELISYIEAMEAETARLEQSISETRAALDQLQQEQEQDKNTISGLSASLATLSSYAGLTDMTGPGLIITLDDNRVGAELAQKNSPATFNAENYIVHDKDILHIVRAIGPYCEALAINNIRLVDTTSIRCTGTVIMVNSARLAPPYEITAIGDPDVISPVLRKSSRYHRLTYNNMPIKETILDAVSVPAYSGVYSTAYSSLLKSD